MGRVLLVAPPEGYITKDYLPPLGLGYIAAVLEENGIEVSILDANAEGLTTQGTTEIIAAHNPEVLGFSATTHTRFHVKTILDNLKDTPSIKVLGGVHFSQTDIDALNHLKADVVVRGEGEFPMLELALGKELHTIKGITYRDDQKIRRNPPREPIKDLDSLPLPARHLFPMDRYNAHLEGIEGESIRSLSLISSRGCPNDCVFCANSAFWGRAFRRRSPIKVVDEMEHIVSTFGINGLDIWDDTFTVNKKHVLAICNEIIERGLDVKWYARVRVNTVNRDILNKMKRAGCVSISYGVETGSPRILKVIKKNITLDQVRSVSRICDDLGFYTKAFFMFNHPEETLEDVSKTLAFIDELLLDYDNISPMVGTTLIYPGTALEVIAKKAGMLDPDFSWNEDYYSTSNESYGLSAVVPAFDNIPLDKLYRHIDTKKDPSALVRKGLKRLRNIRSMREFTDLCGAGWKAFGSRYLRHV